MLDFVQALPETVGLFSQAVRHEANSASVKAKMH